MEKNKKILFALSKPAFEHLLKANNIDDSNVEELKDIAFISIEDPYISINHINKHYFQKDYDNVLNMDFYDIEKSSKVNDYKYNPITEEQAKEIFDFIEKHLNSSFIVHCEAGISRSGAVARFISNYYGYSDAQFKDYIMPNQLLLKLLKKEYKKKYKKI
jgi:predicted protein tyrosine phosphatase